MSAPAIGIDLGTTYSCVAVCRGGRAEVIANALGNRVTPSVVAFGQERLVGDAAKEKEALNPENTIFDVKRLIGRRFDDQNVQRDMKTWPFEVINESDKPKVRVTHQGQKRSFYPEEISAMVLTSLKTTAEKYLGKAVRNAVVTVPAHFTDSQRQATKDAATIAGLKVLRIINEPTAAALAYGHADTQQDERQVLVFDLGGGTFDVSILTIEEGIFEVRSTAGDTHLGGTDFDARLVEHFAREFERRHGADVRGDKYALRRLRTASERAKRTLSVASEASVELDGLHAGRDFRATVTRALFERLCEDLFRGTLAPVRLALRDAGMEAADVDEVVLVGGSTRIPAVQRILRELFPDKELTQTVNPDEAVAVGAAVQAALLDGDPSHAMSDLVLVDVTPLSLGTIEHGNISSIIIPRNTTIPAKKTKNFTTVYDSQTSIRFKIIEGERPMGSDNTRLGEFTLSGIPPAPREVPSIAVTYEIDADGILHATAVDRSTHNKESIILSCDKGRLSQDEINRIIRESEAFKQEDQRKKAAAEARNALEYKCYDARKAVGNTNQRNKGLLLQKVEEILLWLRSDTPVTKDECERKMRELDVLC